MGFQAERDIYDVPATPPFVRQPRLQNPSVETTIRLSAKSQTYGWDNIDESGSVSSMSSGKKATHCHICLQEDKPTKPLVACISCRRRFHLWCHQPHILQPGPRWRCSRCASTSTSTSVSINTNNSTNASTRPSWQNVMLRSSPFSQSSPKSPDPKARPQRPLPLNELTEPHPYPSTMCEVHGCTTFAIRSIDGIKVCKRHEVEPRHKPVTTQKPGVAMKTATLPKVNKKAKLHPVKLENDFHTLKRKRSSGLPKVAGTSEPSKYLGESIPPRVHSTVAPNTQVGSNNANGVTFNIQRVYEQPETPEYEPPPPTLDNSPSPWLSIVENPESQLAEEARANRESSTIYVDVPGQRTNWEEVTRKENKKLSKEIILENISSTRKGLQTISPPESSVIQNSRHGSTSRTSATSPVERSTHELIKENLTSRDIDTSKPAKPDGKPDHFEDQPSHDPPEPSLGPADNGRDSNYQEVVSAVVEKDISASAADSIEVTQIVKQTSFDESVLDRYLSAQTQVVPSLDPNSSNLLLRQPWGHIDPREAWPKEVNQDWLGEKLKEIESRPKRKANFGKVLTAQNIKERRENGWHIHQNKALPARDCRGYSHIEELFAVKDIEELEPSVRNGVLVMAEKAFDENGKRRKKNSLKVFPVS